MGTRSHARGSGGDRAPGPTPTEVYNPGDVVRYRVGPSGLSAIAAQTVFVVEARAAIATLLGSSIQYLIAAGNWRQWVTPANLVRVDPPAPSGFVAAPQPPESGDALVDPLGAVADGIIANTRAEAEARARGTAKPDVRVDPSAARAACDEAPAAIEWQGAAAGDDRIGSADGRFAIVISAGLRSAHDHWTGELSRHATLSNAKAWCARRHREGGQPLEWSPNDGAVGAAGPNRERFYCQPAADGRSWYGVDTRLPDSSTLRTSDHFFSPDEAKRWCEVRAACVVEGNALRWESPVPF